jgi:hypothetical protein
MARRRAGRAGRLSVARGASHAASGRPDTHVREVRVIVRVARGGRAARAVSWLTETAATAGRRARKELGMDRFERIDNQKEGASMAEQANVSRRELEARLLDKALKDAAFRRALVEDPRGTLERELGVTVPDGVGLTVLQETPTARYLVLPLAPSRGDGMLTDAELEAVAGGPVFTYPGDCSTIGC